MSKDKKLSVNEEIEILKKQISRERVRVNRIVQVLLNNLSDENLDKKVNFSGYDCHDNWQWKVGAWDDFTLRDFLRDVVDP